MKKLDDLVQALLRPQAGGGGKADRQRQILGLKEYSSAQRQRGTLLAMLLLLLLAAPIALSFANVPKDYLPYLFGGTGVLAAGTIKAILAVFQDISRAQTLSVICQHLESVDAREVLVAWTRGRE